MLAVVGPTATGKTALGVALAEAFEGEVISADSMQIYKGLDVGTAKVAPGETHGVPHHAVDILEPDESFSVADFVALAGTLEADISARGRLPILVGGTGLYVQSFLYGVRFAAELAAKLAHGSRDALNERTEWVLHSISCRAAIKAGDHTSPQELMALAEKILSGEVPPFCPHGRPCVLKLTRKELEKQFGRIV